MLHKTGYRVKIAPAAPGSARSGSCLLQGEGRDAKPSSAPGLYAGGRVLSSETRRPRALFPPPDGQELNGTSRFIAGTNDPSLADSAWCWIHQRHRHAPSPGAGWAGPEAAAAGSGARVRVQWWMVGCSETRTRKSGFLKLQLWPQLTLKSLPEMK